MIDAISLRNFKQFAELDLVLRSQMVFFVGPNEAGKSTIRDAISFALLGTVPGVETKKGVPPVVIRDGSTSAEVTLFMGEVSVRRRVTISGKEELELRVGEGDTQEVYTGVQETQKRVADYLGLNADHLRVALDGWQWFGLGEDRLGFLRQVFGVAPTLEQILQALEKRGLTGELAGRAAELAANAGFRTAETEAVEWRRAAKREQRIELGEAPPATIETATGPKPLDKLDAGVIERTIAGLEGERDALLSALGAELAGAREQVRTLEARVSRARQQHDAGAVGKIEEAIQSRRTRAAELRAEAQEWQAKVDPLAVHPGQAGEIKKPDVCPAIPHGFQCPAKPADLKKHQAAVTAARDALMERHRASSEAGAEASSRRIQADTLEREIGSLESSLAQRRREAEEYQQLAADLPRTEALLKQTRERVLELAEPAKQPKVIALAERIAAGRKILAAKVLFDDYSSRAAALPTAQSEAAARETLADGIAKALGTGPEGIEHELVADSRRALAERMRTTGSLLGHVEIDDALDLVVQTRAGRRSFAQLSKSQRLRLGLVAQDLVSFRAGLRFLVVDEADTFDNANLGALVRLLGDLVTKPYQRVLVMATRHVEPDKLRCPLGAQMFHLHDGVAEEVA